MAILRRVEPFAVLVSKSFPRLKPKPVGGEFARGNVSGNGSAERCFAEVLTESGGGMADVLSPKLAIGLRPKPSWPRVGESGPSGMKISDGVRILDSEEMAGRSEAAGESKDSGASYLGFSVLSSLAKTVLRNTNLRGEGN